VGKNRGTKKGVLKDYALDYTKMGGGSFTNVRLEERGAPSTGGYYNIHHQKNDESPHERGGPGILFLPLRRRGSQVEKGGSRTKKKQKLE